MEGHNSPDIFVSLSRAYEDTHYTHCDGPLLLPCYPVKRLEGVLPVFLLWHHTAHHIPQIPRKSPEPDMGYRISPPVAGGRPWPFCFIKANQSFSQHSALPVCNHGLQLSALTRPWGGFVSNSPQWGPLILQVTSTCPPDFTFSSSFITLLSVPELHRLSTKMLHGAH